MSVRSPRTGLKPCPYRYRTSVVQDATYDFMNNPVSHRTPPFRGRIWTLRSHTLQGYQPIPEEKQVDKRDGEAIL